jgi:uncharacterized protein YndB with AHSA1/START domain
MSKLSQRRTDTAALEVAATPEHVYEAFSRPEVLMRWLPPDSMTGRALEYDFREGGRYRIELTYPDDGSGTAGKTSEKTDVSRGRFVALERGRRIVQTVEFDATDPDFGGEMTMTWSFEPTATGTRVTVTAQDVPPGISKTDHDEGLRASLANLARHVS